MSRVPSKEEFEITLATIAERDAGTPELLEEVGELKSTEEAIRAFLEKRIKLIDSKLEAVKLSPVPQWLHSQPEHQKGLKLAFKQRSKQLNRETWLDIQLHQYLNSYKPVTESNFNAKI